MSLRHREVVYSQQQREAELLTKLRNCSNFLQSSLNLIDYDTPEKKAFKLQAVQFLNESIALGSEDTESSSDGHTPSEEFPSSAENPINSFFLNRAEHSIAEYLSRQFDNFSEENLPSSQQPTEVAVDPISTPAPIPIHRKRSHEEASEPPAKFPHLSEERSVHNIIHSPTTHFPSHATAFNPPHSSTSTTSFLQPIPTPFAPTPTSISSTSSAPLSSQFCYGIPPPMTISQSCNSGQPFCSPLDGNVLELMFSLSSEVNPSSANLCPSSAPAPQPVPSLNNLSTSCSNPAPSASGLLCGHQTLTPTDDQPSTNIADVMAWIKSNPLKTTKRYIWLYQLIEWWLYHTSHLSPPPT